MKNWPFILCLILSLGFGGVTKWASAQNLTPVIGAGTSLNSSVLNALYPYGMTPANLATYPACTLANVGAHIFVNNATAPAFNTVLAGAGAVFVEGHCVYSGASTYIWVGF